jgi:hypothetical protein
MTCSGDRSYDVSTWRRKKFRFTFAKLGKAVFRVLIPDSLFMNGFFGPEAGTPGEHTCCRGGAGPVDSAQRDLPTATEVDVGPQFLAIDELRPSYAHERLHRYTNTKPQA